MSRRIYSAFFFLATVLAFVSAGALGAIIRDAAAVAKYPDLYEASIVELQSGLEKNQFTSVDLVKVSSLGLFLYILTDIFIIGIPRPYRRGQPQRPKAARCDRN